MSGYQNVGGRFRYSVNAIANTTKRIRPFSLLLGTFFIYYTLFFYNRNIEEYGQNDATKNLLYVTNFAVLLGGISMVFQNPFFLGVSISLVWFSHLSFAYDLLLWCFYDTQAFGRVSYLDDPDPHIQELWPLTLHQLWFLPISLLTLHFDFRNVGVPVKAWGVVCLINMIINTVGYFWFPDTNGLVPNFSTGHELWHLTPTITHHHYHHPHSQPSSSSPEQSLIQPNVIHSYDKSAFPVYLFYSFLLQSVLFNGLCFIFLKLLSFLLLEDTTKVIISWGNNKNNDNTGNISSGSGGTKGTSNVEHEHNN